VEVGIVIEPFSGMLIRREGADWIMFNAAMGGASGPFDLYHTDPACTSPRYTGFVPGGAFVYFGVVHAGAVFYAKTLDPSAGATLPIVAVEHFGPSDDAMLPAKCGPVDPMNPPPAFLGVATGVSDPPLANLVLPLQIK
jgi:hypothetical protein